MDSLSLAIAHLPVVSQEGELYWLAIPASPPLPLTPAQVAGLPWNGWPEWRGIGGRNPVESVADLPWNRWLEWRGIRSFEIEWLIRPRIEVVSACLAGDMEPVRVALLSISEQE